MLTEEYLQRLVDQCLPAARQGKVASYIPKLAEADGNQLGVYWMEPNGAGVGAGQWQKRVTVQSIVKVAIFLQALADCPLEQMTQKISLNATAETFNSIVDLEEKNQHRPLNPYINSGAIATLSLVQGGPGQRFQRVLELLQALTGNSRLTVEEEVYRSEKATGDRNRALAYFMRSTQILSEEVEPLLDDYFRLCSVLVDCRDLAAFAATLAKGGVDPLTGRRCASREHCRTALAVMVSCGMYGQSGDFLVRTGVPAKSGVGGGIMAAVPGRAGIGVIGPALNATGNSSGGMELLARLAQQLDLSILS
ncbi:MAG TPA: glutaminase A [Firmicutes bacterium]|nr:glutaminase A [Bacillota bacterium]